MKFGHTVKPADQERIECQVSACGSKATVCLYGDPVGYYYHCDKHTAQILNKVGAR